MSADSRACGGSWIGLWTRDHRLDKLSLSLSLSHTHTHTRTHAHTHTPHTRAHPHTPCNIDTVLTTPPGILSEQEAIDTLDVAHPDTIPFLAATNNVVYGLGSC